MSEKTYEDLDAAIRAHIDDEHGGALVSGWAMVVAYITDEADAAQVLKQRGQQWHSVLGLFEAGRQLMSYHPDQSGPG